MMIFRFYFFRINSVCVRMSAGNSDRDDDDDDNCQALEILNKNLSNRRHRAVGLIMGLLSLIIVENAT